MRPGTFAESLLLGLLLLCGGGGGVCFCCCCFSLVDVFTLACVLLSDGGGDGACGGKKSSNPFGIFRDCKNDVKDGHTICFVWVEALQNGALRALRP